MRRAMGAVRAREVTPGGREILTSEPVAQKALNFGGLMGAPGEDGDDAAMIEAKEGLAKARSAFWKAQKDELAAQREAGLLVDRAAVVAAIKSAVGMARTKLLLLPGALCQALAVESDARAIEQCLEERIRGVLEELARAGDAAGNAGGDA